jgi:hypothetical protein
VFGSSLSLLIKMFTQKNYSTDTYLEPSEEIEQTKNLAIVKHLSRYAVDFHKVIFTLSMAIILLGLVHISFAFFTRFSPELIWYISSGTAIVFSGLLNVIAIERGGSKFSKAIALIVNGTNCLIFSIAALFFMGLEVFMGILIFFVTTISFFIDFKRQPL